MTKEEKYEKVYELMLKQGFVLVSDLSKLIGIKSIISIRNMFEALDLYTYDDKLTEEEKKITKYNKSKPQVLRPLKPLYDKWRNENKQKPKKCGHVRTGERGMIK